MDSRFFKSTDIQFNDHPKFANVKIAILVTGKDTAATSVCLLDIAPATNIPVHTHDPQIDSIYVVSGNGQAFVNGEWKDIAAGDYIFVPAMVEHGIKNTGSESLKLFIHHSPPLF